MNEAIEDMNPVQARAARYGLRFTAKDVADRSGVSDFTVKRFEKDQYSATQKTIDAMKNFYCSCGVLFTEDDQGYGVKFKPDIEIMPARHHRR